MKGLTPSSGNRSGSTKPRLPTLLSFVVFPRVAITEGMLQIPRKSKAGREVLLSSAWWVGKATAKTMRGKLGWDDTGVNKCEDLLIQTPTRLAYQGAVLKGMSSVRAYGYACKPKREFRQSTRSIVGFQVSEARRSTTSRSCHPFRSHLS